MERNNKYLVLKRDDIKQYLTPEQQNSLDYMLTKIEVSRLQAGKQATRNYVVVADNLPMYEQVWSMLEQHVDSNGANDERTD